LAEIMDDFAMLICKSLILLSVVGGVLGAAFKIYASNNSKKDN